MSDVHCPKCGSSKSKSWITCSLYPEPDGSPLRNKPICMRHCSSCSYHIEDGTSLEWCGYRRQHPQAPTKDPSGELPVNALTMQMKRKLGKAEYFYKTGKTRIADNLSEEAAWLDRKIRRIKINA